MKYVAPLTRGLPEQIFLFVIQKQVPVERGHVLDTSIAQLLMSCMAKTKHQFTTEVKREEYFT